MRGSVHTPKQLVTYLPWDKLYVSSVYFKMKKANSYLQEVHGLNGKEVSPENCILEYCGHAEKCPENTEEVSLRLQT